MNRSIVRFAIGSALIAAVAVGFYAPSGAETSRDYPYYGRNFMSFVTESYSWGQAKDPAGLQRWIQDRYQQASGSHGTVRDLLSSEKSKLKSISSPEDRAKAEQSFGARVHKLVKGVIPKFSLDNGFEFFNVVRRGERQCFLQSVLISSMLQQAGIRSGVVMVYKNNRGESTNNGHAVCLERLSNGTDIIVDASDADPFAKHRGLFVDSGGPLYVEPVFKAGSPVITKYRKASSAETIATRKVETFGNDFLRSQFYYYRGERPVGGVIASHPTREGLEKSRTALTKSVRLYPGNPLAVYMLGRTYAGIGRYSEAAAQIARAHKLYAKYGWVPEGVNQYLQTSRQRGWSKGRS